MLQIIGLLLCVYLCYKGLEILQISMAAPQEHWTHQWIGVGAFVSSVLIAGLFAYWLIEAGNAMPSGLPRTP